MHATTYQTLHDIKKNRVHTPVSESRPKLFSRDAKGAKDRITMLPESLKSPLQKHLQIVKSAHEKDLSEGWGKVVLPFALERKYSNAPYEWRWQWVFPQENRWKNTKNGEEGRHHVHETILQRAVHEAVRKARVAKHVGCHTFRHSYATHLLFVCFKTSTGDVSYTDCRTRWNFKENFYVYSCIEETWDMNSKMQFCILYRSKTLSIWFYTELNIQLLGFKKLFLRRRLRCERTWLRFY